MDFLDNVGEELEQKMGNDHRNMNENSQEGPALSSLPNFREVQKCIRTLKPQFPSTFTDEFAD
jgi:hypothetical protein